MAISSGYVFIPNLLDNFCREFGVAIPLAAGHASLCRSAGSVVLVRAFKDVARIEACRRIAAVTSARFRPSAVYDEESKSVDPSRLSVERDISVSVLVFIEGPEKA